ncbi:MAG: adenylate/guanylate cyclase domain-containing protein [Rhodoferax sp.]|nr:adenylate/guanylate cyclase domain-containing protein [Rhodoferax sp.]
MRYLLQHRARIAVTLLPLVFAVLHAIGWLRIGLIDRLETIIYDFRLVATMPRTLDPRVVIVDIDERSLAEVGRWPWSRNRLADLMNELFDRQQIAVAGFDVVFAEPDESSGLKQLQELARGALRDQPAFSDRLGKLQDGLDYDGRFARALENRPVVMGYYLTGDRQGRKSGVLPAPVFDQKTLQGRRVASFEWDGYGSNIERLAEAAPQAGFFNTIEAVDGVVRSVPLVAELGGNYYESLSLAMFRVVAGMPGVMPGFPQGSQPGDLYQGLESVVLRQGAQSIRIPVDDRIAVLVPYRGLGGPEGGSYRYVSASDVLGQRLAPGELRDKMVLIGTTAPGLLDLRTTPVGNAYPGVEAHANVISSFLDGRNLVRPDYAAGFEMALLIVVGLTLALALPGMSAVVAVVSSGVTLAGLVGLNVWLYQSANLVLPLALLLTLTVVALVLNMSYGYFVESRSKRDLAQLFGTYVPPELVDEMVKDPERYSMSAANQELTVMFCDMRGFTSLSERMQPLELQALLNAVFSRLTRVIRSNLGTIDKYMGDCVMAFWGAPVPTADHARLAVKSALEMNLALREINREHEARGIPSISLGVGLNTGTMCVGDMGSDIRRSYTVIGDAVNLGSRLEGLSKVYGVDTVVSESTRDLAPEFIWQELDRVRVKGKAQAVSIYWPVGERASVSTEQQQELRLWSIFLEAYRRQDWSACDEPLREVLKRQPGRPLYHLYADRLAERRAQPTDPDWDGATNFETK